MLASEFALKTISNAGLDNREELKQRFRQESLALSQLTSEHVVRVYETGEASGTLYMVLELIRGLSLKQHLAREGRLKLIDAARIVSQILSALEHAHTAGLVHRDLKPSNILFTNLDAQHIKLIDFGIAKSMQPPPEASPLTRTGLVIGTVQYMAPEQLRQNLPVGPATDLYATGILFYQFVMGETPFTGSQAEIAAGHLYQYPPKIDSNLNISQGISEWLQTALAKEPAERFPNAMTMRVELAKAMGTSEENLSTTVPVNNDTIRMTPDLSFMHNMITSMPSETVLDQARKKQEQDLSSNRDDHSTEAHPTTTMDSDSASLSSLLNECEPGEEGEAKKPNVIVASEEDQRPSSKKTNNDFEEILDPKMPAATQKLSPLHLQKIASKTAKETSKPVTEDNNNRTALADIPVMLFTGDSQAQEENPAPPQQAEFTNNTNKETGPPPLDASTIQTPSYDSEPSNTLAQGSSSATKEPPAKVGPNARNSNSIEEVDRHPSQETLDTMDSKLAPQMPITTPKPSSIQRPIPINAKRTENTQINFELPDALGWWVVPLTMVLSIIAYFIWF